MDTPIQHSPVQNPPTQVPQPIQPQTFSAPEQPRGSKWRLILIILLILSIISFGGYYLILPKMGVNILPTPTPTPTIVKLPSPTPDPTVNWETYTSQNDGYTLKYPQDWNYKQNNPWQTGDIDFSSTKNSQQLFQISVNNDLVSLDTIVKDLGNKGNVSDIIIDGVDGKSVNFTMPSPPGNGNNKFQLQQIELLKNNKHYTLTTERLEGSSDDTPNQILSTFKFLSPSPTSVQNQTIDTSNWKTYTNEKYGYTIKYPNNFSFEDKNLALVTFNNKIKISVDTYSHDPKDCKAECPNIISDENMNINGIYIRKISSQRTSVNPPGKKYTTIEHIVKKGEKYYVISYYYLNDSKNIDDISLLEKMISTFKFTN